MLSRWRRRARPLAGTLLEPSQSLLQRELHLARGCHPRHRGHPGIGRRPHDLEIEAGTHGELGPCTRRLPHVRDRDDGARADDLSPLAGGPGDDPQRLDVIRCLNGQLDDVDA